jgi:BlaI family transcriptional regulator, penicillinase repressor
MARPASKHPTDGELEILRILWANDNCTLAEVCDQLRKEREVATTTVATMLRVMLEKRLVRRKSAGPKAGQRGYQWAAAVSQEKTAGTMLGKLVDGVFEGSASRLVAHLVETEKLTEEELVELEALVDARRRAVQKQRAPNKTLNQ